MLYISIKIYAQNPMQMPLFLISLLIINWECLLFCIIRQTTFSFYFGAFHQDCPSSVPIGTLTSFYIKVKTFLDHLQKGLLQYSFFRTFNLL